MPIQDILNGSLFNPAGNVSGVNQQPFNLLEMLLKQQQNVKPGNNPNTVFNGAPPIEPGGKQGFFDKANLSLGSI